MTGPVPPYDDRPLRGGEVAALAALGVVDAFLFPLSSIGAAVGALNPRTRAWPVTIVVPGMPMHPATLVTSATGLAVRLHGGSLVTVAAWREVRYRVLVPGRLEVTTPAVVLELVVPGAGEFEGLVEALQRRKGRRLPENRRSEFDRQRMPASRGAPDHVERWCISTYRYVDWGAGDELPDEHFDNATLMVWGSRLVCVPDLEQDLSLHDYGLWWEADLSDLENMYEPGDRMALLRCPRGGWSVRITVPGITTSRLAELMQIVIRWPRPRPGTAIAPYRERVSAAPEWLEPVALDLGPEWEALVPYRPVIGSNRSEGTTGRMGVSGRRLYYRQHFRRFSWDWDLAEVRVTIPEPGHPLVMVEHVDGYWSRLVAVSRHRLKPMPAVLVRREAELVSSARLFTSWVWEQQRSLGINAPREHAWP